MGKIKVWKPQEESECRRMEAQITKNNSDTDNVPLHWNFKLAAFESLFVFWKASLIFNCSNCYSLARTAGFLRLSFCPATLIFFPVGLVVATESSAASFFHPA